MSRNIEPCDSWLLYFVKKVPAVVGILLCDGDSGNAFHIQVFTACSYRVVHVLRSFPRFALRILTAHNLWRH